MRGARRPSVAAGVLGLLVAAGAVAAPAKGRPRASAGFVPMALEGKPVFDLVHGEDGAWYAVAAAGLHRRAGWRDPWVKVAAENDLPNLRVTADGLLLAGEKGECAGGAQGENSLRASRDGGRSWKAIGARDDEQARPIRGTGARLVALGCTVSVAERAGLPWQTRSTGGDGEPFDAAVGPGDSLYIAEATEGLAQGVWWLPVGPSAKRRRVLETRGATDLFVDRGGRLYAADDLGVRRSSDGGRNWVWLNGGLEAVVKRVKADEGWWRDRHTLAEDATTGCLLLATGDDLFVLGGGGSWNAAGRVPRLAAAIPTPDGLCVRVLERPPSGARRPQHAGAFRILCDPRKTISCR